MVGDRQAAEGIEIMDVVDDEADDTDVILTLGFSRPRCASCRVTGSSARNSVFIA